MRKVRFQHQRKLRQSTSKGNEFSARVSVSEISCPDFRKTLRKSLQMHCNVTIGRIKLAEFNQSGKEKVTNEFPDLVENNETKKDTEIRNTTETRTFPSKTKGPTDTITPTRRCRKRSRKFIQIRTPRENRRR